jgi:hypothetical protein
VEVGRVVSWAKLGHAGEIGWPSGGEKERRKEGRWPAKLLGRRGEKREVGWAGKGERERGRRWFFFFKIFSNLFKLFFKLLKFKLFFKLSANFKQLNHAFKS